MNNPIYVAIDAPHGMLPSHLDHPRGAAGSPVAGVGVQAPLAALGAVVWGNSISTLDVSLAGDLAAPQPVAVAAEPDEITHRTQRHKAHGVAPTSKPMNRHPAGPLAHEKAILSSLKAAIPPAPAGAGWEVDRLCWPAVSERLCQRETEYFRHAGEKLVQASQQGLRVLAMTSSQRGEGCTTLAICLARAVSVAGARVALLDADLQHPELCRQLSLSFAHGWQDVLQGRQTWTESAVVSLEDQLTLIPARHDGMLDTPAARRAASRVFREIASAFDLLIVDLGRLTPDSGELLGRGADCMANAGIVVRDVRKTSEESTLVAAARLKMLGLEAVGVAENFAADRAARAAA
jgi:Mrp family chromosome partitioning ATPase